MTKHLVDIDDDKLDQARELLGTKTIKDTVDRVIDEVISLERRQRLSERLRLMKGIDLNDAEIMKGAWR